MPLPIQDVERELTHTRRVRFEGYRRADGLWDIEGHLTDVKNHDFTLQTGVRRAGCRCMICGCASRSIPNSMSSTP